MLDGWLSGLLSVPLFAVLDGVGRCTAADRLYRAVPLGRGRRLLRVLPSGSPTVQREGLEDPDGLLVAADDQGPPARAGARMPGLERRTNSPAALAGSPLHGLPWRAGIAF